MDQSQVELTQEQQEALLEELKRGAAFEEMLTSNGWAYIHSYYQNQIKAFINDMMNQADQPIIKFEDRRHELLGLKKLLSQIDSAVRTFKSHQEQQLQKQEEKEKQNG